MRLQTTPIGSATRSVFEAYCFVTDTVGDAVYIMGNKVGDRYQVTKVNIDSLPTLPAIGIIVRKTSSSDCEVQTSGIIKNIYTGMTPQKQLFIGTDSRLTETVTQRKPTPGSRALQIMGQVIATTELLLDVKSPIILTT